MLMDSIEKHLFIFRNSLVFRPELMFTVNLSSADFFVVIITTPFAAFDP
jgi:hypothetical protein